MKNPDLTLSPRSLASVSLLFPAIVVSAGLLAACGGSDTGGSGGATTSTTTSSASGGGGSGGDTGTATGSSDPNILAGTFQIQLIEEKPANGSDPGTPGATTVLGKVYDGAYPAQLVWELDTADGDCKLVKPRVPFCSTPCGGTAVCVEDETCQDYPKAHSAGTVTAKGLQTTDGKSEITMEPVANNYQVPVGTTLKYPAFAAGDDVSIHAAGDYYAAFDIATKGIEQLVITSATPDLKSGSPIDLAWTAPSKDVGATVHIKLDISHHGGTKGMIECDTADDGAYSISADLVTKLLALGVAGYPTIVLTRRVLGSTTIAPGRVDLVLASPVERTVTVDGLVSCTADTDCPQGQTCQSDLSCK